MSSKINIIEIVTGHYKTLKGNNGKFYFFDLITFIIIPLFLATFSFLLGFDLDKNLSSLLVNFGAIFTALLLSVLVLVYDQENKIEKTKSQEGSYNDKKELLRQLYYNISHSILSSIGLVIFCLIHSVLSGDHFNIIDKGIQTAIDYMALIITCIIVFNVSSLLLNILMIVKRMHALLVTQ